jgi:hypothetical protein
MRIGNFSFVIMLGAALGGGSQSMMRRVVRTWRDGTCLARPMTTSSQCEWQM